MKKPARKKAVRLLRLYPNGDDFYWTIYAVDPWEGLNPALGQVSPGAARALAGVDRDPKRPFCIEVRRVNAKGAK